MKQENIKKIMEQIRSKKNNETNELVAMAEEVSLLNATTEATMSVASHMISADWKRLRRVQQRQDR